MSTSKAISAVTEKLLLVLDRLMPTAKPLDKAGTSPLNVFLYQAAISAAWRNQDLPASNPGQPRRPLLPLNLYYLISACEENQIAAHDKLGQAMLLLHDHPELRDFHVDSVIKNQADPIRVTLQPLTLDEISKLWSAFQFPYRPSVAYEIGIVLLESELPDTVPLPVTRRGPEDTGWDSSAQFPATVTSVQFQTPNQPGVRLDERLTLVGQNLLQSGELRVAFRHPVLPAPLKLEPDRTSDREISVRIPNEPHNWPAGVYMACIQNTVGRGLNARTRSSNEVPVALLPEILVPPGGLKVDAAHAPELQLTVPCQPAPRKGQRVELLIGSVSIETFDPVISSKPVAKWSSSVLKIPPGDRPKEKPFARLRIDGVDSLVYNPADIAAEFDKNLLVKGIP